jgi:hypothetical protein
MEAIMAHEAQTTFLSKILPSDVGGKQRTVIFAFGNGARLELCLDDLNDDMREQLALHGLSQKGGDSTSNLSKNRDFAGGYAAVQTVCDNLRNGLWSSRVGSSTSDLILAVARILKIDEDAAAAKVRAADDEQLAAIRKNPEVKAAIAKIQEARAKEAAKAAPKLEDLLGSLGM